jgi:hypothetical protein
MSVEDPYRVKRAKRISEKVPPEIPEEIDPGLHDVLLATEEWRKRLPRKKAM